MRPVFKFESSKPTLRPALYAALLAALLTMIAVPALSSDTIVSGYGAGIKPAPSLVPTTAVAPDSTMCALILRGDVPMGGRVAAAKYGHNVIPAAIIGMMTGVYHVTGPQEQAVAFIPADAAASLDGRNARAIAAYRQCRAEAALRALSN